MSYPPAGPYVFGAIACSSSRTSRNTVGMPTVTSASAAIRPRRRRSSMNRVVIIAAVGIGDPR